MAIPEPWLRGPLADVHPLIMPVFFSFAQVREDLGRYLPGLTVEQIWRPFDSASVGFHVKHMAGSVDRLTTYLMGHPLSDEQLHSLHAEQVGNEDAPALLAQVDAALQSSETQLRTIDPDALYAPRTVGRKALPTTVLGLIVHLAEHTQRHLGQTITLCKALRQPV